MSSFHFVYQAGVRVMGWRIQIVSVQVFINRRIYLNVNYFFHLMKLCQVPYSNGQIRYNCLQNGITQKRPVEVHILMLKLRGTNRATYCYSWNEAN